MKVHNFEELLAELKKPKYSGKISRIDFEEILEDLTWNGFKKEHDEIIFENSRPTNFINVYEIFGRYLMSDRFLSSYFTSTKYYQVFAKLICKTVYSIEDK
jgi:hypothetical protein